MMTVTYDLDTWREGDQVFSAMAKCVGGAYVLAEDYEALQSELAAARTQIALYLDDYEQLCALMLRRDKDLAAAREEIARARAKLIREWTGMGWDKEVAIANATERYAREIAHAHKGEEGQQYPDIGPHERAGCSPWNCWLKDGTKCTVLEGL